jgi:hypothetical protein
MAALPRLPPAVLPSLPPTEEMSIEQLPRLPESEAAAEETVEMDIVQLPKLPAAEEVEEIDILPLPRLPQLELAFPAIDVVVVVGGGSGVCILLGTPRRESDIS